MQEIPDVESQIQEDIGRCKIKYGTEWASKFLNNFHLNLPPGGYIKLYDDEEMMDEVMWKDPSYSERKRSKTPREFFADCKFAAAQTGLTHEALNKFREKLNREGADCVDHSILLPAYMMLRKMGYNHHPDLTS